jgi:hypothetical protein
MIKLQKIMKILVIIIVAHILMKIIIIGIKIAKILNFTTKTKI